MYNFPHPDQILPDPGLVENSPLGEHCVHACFQMIFRTSTGRYVPSFDELDALLGKEVGKYTWEFNLLAEMPKLGFETKIIWQLDLNALAIDPESFLLLHYGEDIGQHNIENSNLQVVSRGAKCLRDSGVAIEQRCPGQADILSLVRDGYYLIFSINQRVLQADPGYVAHNILAYGTSKRGLRIHNPGPPATAATEVTWEMFDKAWSYPTTKARNIMAFKPK